jgi:hypothetical protein
MSAGDVESRAFSLSLIRCLSVRVKAGGPLQGRRRVTSVGQQSGAEGPSAGSSRTENW